MRSMRASERSPVATENELTDASEGALEYDGTRSLGSLSEVTPVNGISGLSGSD
jgi:hypothetical protein